MTMIWKGKRFDVVRNTLTCNNFNYERKQL